MRIGEIIEGWRHSGRMGVREAAAMIGISSATLSRVENGGAIDGATMWKLMVFLFGDAGAVPRS